MTEHEWSSVYEFPLRVVSHANARVHWTKAQRTKREEKSATTFAWYAHGRPRPPRYPATVKLTRVSPGTLDDDNLRGSLKYVRDQLARLIGLENDAGPEVEWLYGQERGRYAVRVEMRCSYVA